MYPVNERKLCPEGMLRHGFVAYEHEFFNYFVYDEKTLSLVGERTKKVFRIGGRVTVMVTRVDVEAGFIDFTLCKGGRDGKKSDSSKQKSKA
jgi:DNA-directed RNA polymerase subunit E'/Rpb7